MAKNEKKSVAKDTAPKKPEIEKIQDQEINDGEQVAHDDEIDEVDEFEEEEKPDDTMLQLEAQVEDTVVEAIVHPKVIAGICERCGVPYQGKWVYDLRGARGWRKAKETDNPSKITVCKHYQHLLLKCSYCKDVEKNKERTLFIYSLPDRPNVLIIACDDYNCNLAHKKRFEIKS